MGRSHGPSAWDALPAIYEDIMLALSHFRSKAAGLPDLLPYAALVDEGIIQGKDGSLIAGFFFRGDDAASATDTERNWLTAQVNNYLSKFDAGWAVWVDAGRIPTPLYPERERSHFQDPVSQLIDEERRHMFQSADRHFETEYALILQYLPPMRREAKLGELVYDDDGQEQDSTEPGDKLLLEFKKRLRDFDERFGDLLHLHRMSTRQTELGFDTDELVNYIHYTITGETVTLRIPDCPMYLDAWLGVPELFTGDTPKLGNKFITCVAIEGFPSVSYPGLLDMLDGLPLAYRWSSRFIFLDHNDAVSALNRYRLKWQQKVRGFWSQVFKTQKGTINTDALNMEKESESAMNDARSGLVAYGYYTPVVVLMHEDRAFLQEQATYVAREIDRRGFKTRIETVNTLEAWLGTLPGQTYPNIRRPLVHTLNLSDLLPLAGVWPGERSNPCPFYPSNSPPLMKAVTSGATPFWLNLHVGDVGHTFVLGPTGAGKSTLIATLQAQFRRYISREGKPATIVAFDKKRSLYALCNALGGVHYDLGNDEAVTPALAPLADIDSDAEALWAEEWIATCFEMQAGRSPSPNQKSEIHKAIRLLRNAPRHSRSLTDFVASVQDAEVRDALNHYTISGPMGHMLDGTEDTLTVSTYTVFELDDVMKLGDKNALPVLLFLFRKFERSLKGQPAMLSLDEAWVMLGHPVFRERIKEWLKEMRKNNCLVLLATQNMSDAVHSGLMDVIIELCPTKILLPNKEADLQGTKEHPGPADLYTMCGLNSKEISILKNGVYKRQYYYKSHLGRRLFELGLGPIALSFVAVSDKEEVASVRGLIDRHGREWPFKWLQKKDISYDHLSH